MTDRPGDGAEEPVDPPELVEPPAPQRVVPSVEPTADDVRGAPTAGRVGEDPATAADVPGPRTEDYGLPTQPAELSELQDEATAAVAPDPIEPVEFDSWLAWPPGAPPIADEVGGAIGELFGERSFHDYSEPPAPPEPEEFPESPRRAARAAEQAEQAARATPALASISPFGMPPDERPTSTAAHPTPLLWLGVSLAAVIALLAVFLIGTRVAGIAASPKPTTRPTVTAPAIPVATAAPGRHDWTELAGGECLQDFSSPFAETFDVVPCDRDHAAQLVYRAPVPASDGGFPGLTEIQGRVPALCGREGVIDLTPAARFTDLQLVAAYPVTGAQWESGQRDLFCFVSRSSGKALTRSVMGDAQQKEWAQRGAPKSGPVATKKAGG